MRIFLKNKSDLIPLIVTYRPEFGPPWIGRPHVAALTLNRLGGREIAAMIDAVAGNKALPATIRQDIIERTDGIPLFVEEITKAVLEADGQEAAERAVAAIPSPSLHTGDIDGSRQHFDRAIALYNPAEHRALAPRFGQDIRVAALAIRAKGLWLLGYPALALADIESALKDGREIDHGPSLMYALLFAAKLNVYSGCYAAASKHADELVISATQKGIGYWKSAGMLSQSMASALLGNASDAVQKITSAINAYRSMGSTLFLPEYLVHLANAHAQLGQIDDARRCIGEAMTIMDASGETWCEAELHRVAGEIALNSPEQDAVRAQTYFERALSVARQQQARSWELRGAMSMARLWRDQGKRQQARDLLAPVYGWFTEGLDTRDPKEARALLDDLAP